MSITANLQAVFLQCIFCIHYLAYLYGQPEEVRAWINSGSKINIMTPAYTVQLGLTPRSTNVDAQKIKSFLLKTHEIIIVRFSMIDKLQHIRFFKKTFLLTNTNIEVVLRIPFLFLSNIDIYFNTKELIWRFYSTVKALPITSQV